jgi:uncharacterized protein
VSPNERLKFLNEEIMEDISDKFNKIGFVYTTLDLKGYRTGSMNETLDL